MDAKVKKYFGTIDRYFDGINVSRYLMISESPTVITDIEFEIGTMRADEITELLTLFGIDIHIVEISRDKF